MSRYAQPQDLLDSEGEDLVYAIFDRNTDGVLDQVAIDRCQLDASAEMDGYISRRYPIPAPVTPAWAKQICNDIAIYRGARSADRLTTELRQRYEDAIKFLENVAAGKVGLGVAESTNPDAGSDGDVKGGEILVSSQPRRFGRDRTRRV